MMLHLFQIIVLLLSLPGGSLFCCDLIIICCLHKAKSPKCLPNDKGHCWSDSLFYGKFSYCSFSDEYVFPSGWKHFREILK